MKTYKTIIALAVIIGAITACSKKEDTTPSGTPVTAENLTTGDWRITYFWDSDHEETSHFTAHTFTFSTNGVISATNGQSTYTGTWSRGTDDSTPKLYISFASPDKFESLSSDWKILELTGQKIRLVDISGGNGGTDYLTFERN